MAKIALVNPVTRKRNKVLRTERCQQKAITAVGIFPPIGLLEIAVYLKHRSFSEIELIDGEIEGLSQEGLSCKIALGNPGLIVLQSTTPTIEDDFCFAALLKERLKESRIIITGIHATVLPEEVLRQETIDYAAIGEPEETVSDLAVYLLRNKGSLKEIQGLAYKDSGRIVINGRRQPKDNYDYPLLPDRTLLENNRYIMPLTGKPFALIKVSRGCDFSCAFCTSKAYYGPGWRARSPENIVAEIKDIKEKTGIDTFLFLADTFNGKKEFVRGLTSLIIAEDLNIKWVSNSRLDLIDEEMASLMQRSGCILVSLGIESYSQRLLKRSGKALQEDAIKRGIDILRKHGIKTYGYFIFGLEGESKAGILRTALRAAFSGLNFAQFYSLTPYPGTPYFQKYGNTKWDGYYHGISDIVSYPGLNKFALKASRYIAGVIFYARPDRLWQLIQYLTQGRLTC